MATHLPLELRKFAAHCNVLRNNYRETRLAAHDLKAGSGPIASCGGGGGGDSGVASSSSTPACDDEHSERQQHQAALMPTASYVDTTFLELSRESDAIVRKTIDARPTLVILGTSYYAKARVVNELFRKNVLPIIVPAAVSSAGSTVATTSGGGATAEAAYHHPEQQQYQHNRCHSAEILDRGGASSSSIESYFYRLVRFHYRPRYTCGLTKLSPTEQQKAAGLSSSNSASELHSTYSSSSAGLSSSTTDRNNKHRSRVVCGGPLGNLSSSKSTVQSDNVAFGSDERAAGSVPMHLLRIKTTAAAGYDEHHHQQQHASAAATTTIVDVGLNHPLLKEGWRVFVSADTFDAVNDHHVTSQKNMDILVNRLLDNSTSASLPIFIYAIDCASLHARHQMQLTQLRDALGAAEQQLTVFFLRISPAAQQQTFAAGNITGSRKENFDNYYAVKPNSSASVRWLTKQQQHQQQHYAGSAAPPLPPPSEASLLLTAPCSLSDNDSDAISTASSSASSSVCGGGCCPPPAIGVHSQQQEHVVPGRGCDNADVATAAPVATAADNAATCERRQRHCCAAANNDSSHLLKLQLVKLGYLSLLSAHNGGGGAEGRSRSSKQRSISNTHNINNNSTVGGGEKQQKLLPAMKPAKRTNSGRKRHSTGNIISSDADVMPSVADDTSNNNSSSFVDCTGAGSGASSSVVDDTAIVMFVRKVLQARLVRAATCLNEFQNQCLVRFTHLAFDLSREASVLPRRLQYAREQEERLYQALVNVVQCKQYHVQTIVLQTIADMREQLVDAVAVDIAADFADAGKQLGTNEIRAHILSQLNAAIARQILQRIRYLRESFTGTLRRCLQQLEERSDDLMTRSYGLPSIAALSAASSVSSGLNDLHAAACNGGGEAAEISSRRSVNSNTSFGGADDCFMPKIHTSQLKQSDLSTTAALDNMLNAAYCLELSADNSTSVLTSLKQRMMSSFSPLVTSGRWRKPSTIGSSNVLSSGVHAASGGGDAAGEAWRRQVAVDFINGLSAERLGRVFCQQFRDRLRSAHEAFEASLRQLEVRIAVKLGRADKTKRVIRKLHAPRLARLALESHSLRDTILFGIPQPLRELGRGQYGVVHACDKWAGHAPCAVKSVVPPDERHRNDLALEIFYTKSVLPHPRLVEIYGSVMDYGYGDSDLASGPSVLIVMERLPRDLYHALKRGLSLTQRLQIALDVIEGIRYLHARGFIHRDIKLKNVLLDKRWRAKLTDFGFCKPNSLISGSVVGTPIHMAPEVFNGGLYNNSVDIYAFGILYWFLCGNRVRLPQAFEPWMSRDLLRSSVKRGVRPERLADFDDDSWSLMQACWAAQPEQRPLPGDIDEKLRRIQQNYAALALLRRSGSLTASTVFSLPPLGHALTTTAAAAGGAGGIGRGARSSTVGAAPPRRVRQRDVNVLGASTPYVELDVDDAVMSNYAAVDAVNKSIEADAEVADRGMGIRLPLNRRQQQHLKGDNDDDDATPTLGNLMHLHRAAQPKAVDAVDGGHVMKRCRDERNYCNVDQNNANAADAAGGTGCDDLVNILTPT